MQLGLINYGIWVKYTDTISTATSHFPYVLSIMCARRLNDTYFGMDVEEFICLKVPFFIFSIVEQETVLNNEKPEEKKTLDQNRLHSYTCKRVTFFCKRGKFSKRVSWFYN